MKLKGLLITTIIVGISFLSSCRGGYTCPTYSQSNERDQPIMVKEVSSNIEINS